MTCPECRIGALEIVLDGLIGREMHPGYHVPGVPLPVVMMPGTFAACNACEFCIEIDLNDLGRAIAAIDTIAAGKAVKDARPEGLNERQCIHCECAEDEHDPSGRCHFCEDCEQFEAVQS